MALGALGVQHKHVSTRGGYTKVCQAKRTQHAALAPTRRCSTHNLFVFFSTYLPTTGRPELPNMSPPRTRSNRPGGSRLHTIVLASLSLPPLTSVRQGKQAVERPGGGLLYTFWSAHRTFCLPSSKNGPKNTSKPCLLPKPSALLFAPFACGPLD